MVLHVEWTHKPDSPLLIKQGRLTGSHGICPFQMAQSGSYIDSAYILVRSWPVYVSEWRVQVTLAWIETSSRWKHFSFFLMVAKVLKTIVSECRCFVVWKCVSTSPHSRDFCRSLPLPIGWWFVMIKHDVSWLIMINLQNLSWKIINRRFPLKAHPSWNPFQPIVHHGIIATLW